ncbi:MAG: SHOCT domain-containing protein [Sinimarinibacterium sp.]|jgi:putative membrane protein
MGFHGEWGFWGMHLLWWIVIVVILAVVLKPLVNTARRRRSTPLEVLQRRYAAGEISTEEYEKRRATLARDNDS